MLSLYFVLRALISLKLVMLEALILTTLFPILSTFSCSLKANAVKLGIALS